MTNIGPRRAWAAAATVAAIAIAGFASVADASIQTLVGVSQVTFAWAPASGQANLYIVSRSLNGRALATYAYVSTNQIQIPIAPGNQIQISVAAGGYDSAGAFRVGPSSPLSDPVVVLATPQFPAVGSWLLRCATCPAVQRRWLGDASLIAAEAAGLPAPWVALGHAGLDQGADTIVWHNSETGELALWDSEQLVPIPGAVGLGGTTLRGVGGADIDHGGIEEFLVQNRDTLATVSAWSLKSNGFVRVARFSGPPGADLVAARDFDLDGRVDLLWQDISAGTLELSHFAGDPVLGAASVWLATLAPTQLVSGLSSDARVVSTGDYDGDGSPDALVRDSEGDLMIVYLQAGVARHFVSLPRTGDDINRSVIDSTDMDGVPGDEIALRNSQTGEISILDVSAPRQPTRTVVLTPGRSWRVIGIAGS